jgi:hypothetical protein
MHGYSRTLSARSGLTYTNIEGRKYFSHNKEAGVSRVTL